MQEVNKYIDDIESGVISSGDNLKLAIKRYKEYLVNDAMYFNEKEVLKIFKFFSFIKHYKDEYKGKPFILLPYQKWIIAYTFGFYYKSSNKRVVNTLYCEIARKNGKSALIAGILLYQLITKSNDGEEIYISANNRAQAANLFEICKNFALSLKLGNALRIYKNNQMVMGNSILKVLSIEDKADSTKHDGYNPSVCVLDEYHAAKDTKMLDVMESGMVARKNPLMIIITTAGISVNSPCFTYRQTAIEVLKGIKHNENQAIIIYDSNAGTDWHDKSTWINSNPSLGTTVTIDKLNISYIKACNSSTDEANFKTKNLNTWIVSNSSTWIDDKYIKAAMKPLQFDYFTTPAYIGVDLSQVSDFTAVSFLWFENSTYYFKTLYYLPENSDNPSAEKEVFKQWAKQGYIKLVEGNAIDYNDIINDLLEIRKTNKINIIGYDSMNALQWAVDMEKQRFKLKPFSQSLMNFNIATKEYERLLKTGKSIVIDENPCTRWMQQNCVLRFDSNGNAKPSKINKKSRLKIDGIIAQLQALAIYLTEPHYSNKVH